MSDEFRRAAVVEAGRGAFITAHGGFVGGAARTTAAGAPATVWSCQRRYGPLRTMPKPRVASCSPGLAGTLPCRTCSARSSHCIRGTTPFPARSSSAWPPARSPGPAPAGPTRCHWKGCGSGSCPSCPGGAGTGENSSTRCSPPRPCTAAPSRTARRGRLVAGRRLLAVRAPRRGPVRPCRRRPCRRAGGAGLPGTGRQGRP
jgi:hypothetical protein